MQSRPLHRLTAYVLVLSFVHDPWTLAQARAASVVSPLFVHTVPGLPPSLDLPVPAAAAPAVAPLVADPEPLPGLAPQAGSPGETACASDLTERRAPVLSLAETLLWPPSHALVDVGLGVDVTTACEGRVTTRVSVYSDEPDDDQTGDGSLPGDARINQADLFLRAERKGDADGRLYLVIVTSSMTDGVSGTACETVLVPHAQSSAALEAGRAQSEAARTYCAASGAAPAGFVKLAESVLSIANDPPVVNAGPDQGVDFPGTAALHGTATDDGRPSGTLAVSWSKVDGPGTVTFDPPGAAETTARFSATGTYTLRLTADDSQFSSSDDAVIVVAVANQAPTVSAGPDQQLTLPAATATLSGVVADDGKPSGVLTATWSVVSPAGAAVAFGDAHAAETTATFPGVGKYVLRLTADDSQFQASDDVQVTVFPEPPPVLTIADASAPEGQEGTTAAPLNLTLSKAWSEPITVDYMTADGTAVAGCDYRTQFGTVRFEPGQTSAQALVPIAGELAPEADETVLVRVGNVSGATLERTEATLTILNDDAPNAAPTAPANRAPADRSIGIVLPPTLRWTATDPDAGDVLTHDVLLGTSFATTGQSWARACVPGAGPGPRVAAVTGYDEASDRLFLFGGSGTADESLWILGNATGAGGASQWTSVATNGGPAGLSRAAAAYDASTNRLFVFGGCTGDCATASDQTWMLSHANGLGGAPLWTRLAATGPGARIDHAAAFDPTTRQVIVFGGSQGASGPLLEDAWRLGNLDALPAWVPVPAPGAGPGPRAGMTASYDPEANELVVFGGRVGTQALADVWVLAHANGTG
ncbi:MAG TPA: kelch repeat-containing protein, partial [Vicinamibacteria bacterium]